MSARALASRVSIPLAICVIGALAAAAMLTRPGPSPSTAAATSSHAEGQHASQNGVAGDSAANGADADAGGSVIDGSVIDGSVIDIVDFGFAGDLTVAAGETVTVTNSDGVVHTLTSVDAAFDTGTLAGGANGSFIAPEVAGTYSFFCAVHPSMSGTLTVTP